MDADTLARATLTYLIEGADALMFASLKGAGNAEALLGFIMDCRPGAPEERAARNRIDQVFAAGLSRWGGRVDAKAMAAFHHALDGWHRRLDALPSFEEDQLRDWFTAGGRQWIIGPKSPHWPAQLGDLSTRRDWASPLCLWGLGDPAALSSCPRPVAVVGSRGASDYGRSVARQIGICAASQGHLVVSGGAMGADAAAHWGALEAMRRHGAQAAGRTVAVFAGGLNHIGPHSNQRLFDAITASGGALISELCPGTIPEARRFLLRNRIIAALASSVVVAQARVRSGALNTAHWANELHREVYAVPGDVTVPDNAGCNRLIARAEAGILASPDDIAELCHPRHAPVITASMPSDETARTDEDRQTPKNGNAPANDIHPGNGDDASPADSADAICAAIRGCARRGMPATPDAIIGLLREQGTPEPPTIASLLGELGRLELEGRIVYEHGELRVANRNRET